MESAEALRLRRFAKFATFLLGFTLLVILWGAFVRASLSGDGCGAHWPLCNGVVVPLGAETETLIEFFHRVTSGLCLPLAVGLYVWARRIAPRRSPLRTAAAFSVVFMITEALVGAWLVLKGLVAENDSMFRAIWMATHLANTFLLLGAIGMTVFLAWGGPAPRLRGQGSLLPALLLGLAGMLLLGVSGAVTALGDTLFPARSLAEGLRQDISPTAHFLIRLRLFHPLIATSVGLYLVLVLGVAGSLRRSALLQRMSKWVLILFGAQMLHGFLNVLTLAPIPMQLMHLLLADLLWLSLLWAVAAALGEGVPQVETEGVHRAAEAASEPAGLRATVKSYVALTKPRVISLLLFTALTAMFAAAGGWPGLGLLLAVALGGYMAAGAANTINMVLERDLDAKMTRTSKRPTVTRAISSGNALAFGFALALGSFALLWAGANLLSAVMALSGLVFYVMVYTLLLKRRTWQNIVIGGAAGAFPPLVGWTAVTGQLHPLALTLFAIVFFWTPVHFWALSLLIKDDYARAGVPMLPVVHGERVTLVQIALYAVLTALISVMPLLQGQVGWVYLATVALLNVALLARAVGLLVRSDRPRIVSFYKFSMAYLGLLFLLLAVDRSWLG
ncbi:MAG: heme o synthase [Fimbriimonadaceae bacterium]